jgi:hypothetical protein
MNGKYELNRNNEGANGVRSSILLFLWYNDNMTYTFKVQIPNLLYFYPNHIQI